MIPRPRPCSNILLSLAVLFFASCGKDQEESQGRVVAEAFGEELRKEALHERIPKGLSKKDSQELAESFVRNWVREQILLQEAEERMKEGVEDIDERVESYRRSLMVHSLEERIVEEQLDTSVSDEEIATFYKEHKKEFNLKEAIVKSNYVRLSLDSAYYASRFLQSLRKDKKEEREAELRELCDQHADRCYLGSDRWKRFRELLSETGLEVQDLEEFLSNNEYLRSRHEEGIYLLRILDHRLKNEAQPLSMAEDRIRSMILNDRKHSIVESFYQNALRDARKKDQVQVR